MKIIRPSLILDKQKCLKNIANMANKATNNNLIFRPHFKTHQSKEIGEWFRQAGVTKITVSSVQMASYFAASGWNNITIAFAFNQLEIEEINYLAFKVKLNILLIHPESVEFLKKNLKHKVGVFIKIDCGYHRTGILAEDFTAINKIVENISQVDNLKFNGFLTHSGHTYQANSGEEILSIHFDTKKKMKVLKDRFIADYPELLISVGDTPSCSLVENFSDIDEIRPGNFVFYDVMQYKLRVCNWEQIAVAAASPIVAKNKQRSEITVYAGGVHLSKEFILDNKEKKIFGLVVEIDENGWSQPLKDAYVSSLSQEHGTIRVKTEIFDKFAIGDVIGILPIHSCMTANLLGEYHTLDGKVLKHL